MNNRIIAFLHQNDILSTRQHNTYNLINEVLTTQSSGIFLYFQKTFHTILNKLDKVGLRGVGNQ